MRRVSVTLRRRREPRPAPTIEAPCYAPFGNLFLNALGEVTACCVARDYPLGNIAEQRLPEIWNGPAAVALRHAIVNDDYSLGCGVCERHIESDMPTMRPGYDYLASTTMTPEYPRSLEINISNSCNLQCVMCSGDYSSSIRIHREGRPALPKVYGEEFFEDLAEFLPHLAHVSFTGGEPFLVPEYPRIWEMLAEVNPDVRAMFTTNGTQWNDRVEYLLSLLRFNVNLSLDGGTKESFERCRVGADWDEVRTNLDRFLAYTRRVGTELIILHCLMAQNYEDFGEVLLLGDELDVKVVVHLVEDPPDCSLERMADPVVHGTEGLRRWGAVRASFIRQAEEVLPRLGRNAAAFEAQYERIMSGVLLASDQTLMGMPWAGRHAFDEVRLAEELGQDVRERSELRAVIGPGQRVVEVSPALASLAEAPPEEFIGATLATFDQAIEAAVGTRGEPTVTAATDDYLCQEVAYGSARFRHTALAVRDATGWMHEVRLYAERLV